MNTTALYLTRQLRHIEAKAAQGLAPGALMLRAADAAYQRIQTHHPDGAIAILCGPGNNGGDGWTLASLLVQAGREVHVFSLSLPDSLPAGIHPHLAAAPAGLTIHTHCPAPQTPVFSIIVDALFGIGLKHPLGAPYADWISWANHADAYRLALDLPSGLAADTGQAHTPCFQADLTLTFLSDKPGLHTADGLDHAGRVLVHTLDVTPNVPPDGHLLSTELARPLFPTRRRNSHKGSYGTLAVIGGQTGMEGAVLLAARTALLSGSGKIFVGWAQKASDSLRLDPLHPELMLRPIASLLRQTPTLGISSWVIGCGLGTRAQANTYLRRLLPLTAAHALVLDADALNLLAQAAELAQALQNRLRPAVLTPHPLEAARLLGSTVQAIQADRIGSAIKLAQRFQAVVVLKGAGTLIADPTGRWVINTSGNPGLASAGTGDVLSGLIGSLSAQGLTSWDAACAGVWLHGAAADYCVGQGIGPIGLAATDLQGAIRHLLNLPRFFPSAPAV